MSNELFSSMALHSFSISNVRINQKIDSLLNTFKYLEGAPSTEYGEDSDKVQGLRKLSAII